MKSRRTQLHYFWISGAELISFGHIGAAICHRLWGAVKDECYADKPETIDVLKDNIREAIGKIQLHTAAIDNVLKYWTDHVGYCMAVRVIWLKLLSIINRKDFFFK